MQNTRNMLRLVLAVIALSSSLDVTFGRPSVSNENDGNGNFGYQYEVAHSPQSYSRVHHRTYGKYSKEKISTKDSAYKYGPDPEHKPIPYPAAHTKDNTGSFSEKPQSYESYSPKVTYPLPYDSDNKQHYEIQNVHAPAPQYNEDHAVYVAPSKGLDYQHSEKNPYEEYPSHQEQSLPIAYGPHHDSEPVQAHGPSYTSHGHSAPTQQYAFIPSGPPQTEISHATEIVHPPVHGDSVPVLPHSDAAYENVSPAHYAASPAGQAYVTPVIAPAANSHSVPLPVISPPFVSHSVPLPVASPAVVSHSVPLPVASPAIVSHSVSLPVASPAIVSHSVPLPVASPAAVSHSVPFPVASPAVVSHSVPLPIASPAVASHSVPLPIASPAVSESIEAISPVGLNSVPLTSPVGVDISPYIPPISHSTRIVLPTSPVSAVQPVEVALSPVVPEDVPIPTDLSLGADITVAADHTALSNEVDDLSNINTLPLLSQAFRLPLPGILPNQHVSQSVEAIKASAALNEDKPSVIVDPLVAVVKVDDTDAHIDAQIDAELSKAEIASAPLLHQVFRLPLVLHS